MPGSSNIFRPERSNVGTGTGGGVSGTRVGVSVGVGCAIGEASAVAVAGTEAIGVVTVCVVAVAGGIVEGETIAVAGTDAGVPVAITDDDCRGPATGVKDDADETVAPGVAVGAFAVGVGVGGPRRLVALAGGGSVVACTTGGSVADSRGVIVGDTAICFVRVAVGVLAGDGWTVPVPAAPTVCDPRVPIQRRLPMIVTMPRLRNCRKRYVRRAAVCAMHLP